MTCPFCKQKLEKNPFGPLDVSNYYCECKGGLKFTHNWRNPDKIRANWYHINFMGFMIEHEKYIDRKYFEDKE